MQAKFDRRPIRRTALAVATAAALGPWAAGPAAAAATCTWDTTAGNWAAFANWLNCSTGNGNPAGSPGSTDSAIIGASGVVTINTAQSILNLSNDGQIDIDAFGLNLVGGGSTTNTGTINVGSATTANLGVSAGHNINNVGGVINVANGSVINQFGSTIAGGTINTTGTGALVAQNSNSSFLSNVALNGIVDMTSVASSREQIVNGATLNGAINIANGGSLGLNSASTTGGNQTLTGTGTINLNSANAHLSIDGNGTTTLASGITVRGQGNIGAASFVGGSNTLISQGLIAADVSGGMLDISPPGNAGSLVNQGTLRASGGGTLRLSTATDNSGGLIDAQNGSVVLQNAVTIVGGAITTSGSGAFAASSGANVLNGVNLNGTLDLSSYGSAREQIVNGATINGVVNIANGGILGLNSASSAGHAQMLSGTATINLDDANAHLSIDGNGSTTLGAGVTVRGQGNIGAASFVGGTNVLTSDGLISADVSGGTLNIVAPGNSGSFINNGTLQAVGGGTLLLSTNITANAGSQIISGAGSSVVQNDVAINGTFSSSGGGFTATNGSNNVLNGVSFTGNLDLSSNAGAREQIVNGATINGSVNIANGGVLGLNSAGTAGGNQTLNGTVTINLNDANAHLSIDGNGSTTLGAGVTVRGQGNIGTATFVGGTNALTNNGLISADVGGGTLNIVAPGNSGSFINNATLQAVNGATLQLSTSISNAGQIVAGAGSRVLQNGVTLNGLITASAAGASLVATGGGNDLNGVHFDGTLDLSSVVSSREQIINGATINGAVNVANGGILGLNSAGTTGGSQTLNGTVTINLNDANARLSIDGNGSTTLGAGVTVHGRGNIGTAAFVGGTNALTNNGLISADVGGSTLSLTPPGNSGSFTNNSTLQAINGGTLLVSTSINNAGLISAQNGSTVVQNGVTLTGGTLASTGSGAFQVIGSGSNFLNNTTLNGTLDMATVVSSREQIINGATINGAINIANGGILGLNSAASSNANQVIGGTGVINLNDAAARLSIDGNGSTTLASGLTVRGQGNIGTAAFVGGNNVLTNEGTISADVNGGTLTIAAPGGAGTLINHGTLQTEAGATMQVPTNFVNDGLMTGVGVFASGGTITNAGHVAPGDAPGTLSIHANFSQTAAGSFDVAVGGLAGASLLVVNGTAALDGALDVICFGACTYSIGQSIEILSSSGSLTGIFAGSPVLIGFASGAFTPDYSHPNQVWLDVTQDTIAAVPEPQSYAMLLAGLAAVGFAARRRHGRARRG